jgi:endogenous inhibitor of DNA gyrase (YacG/DUF329 family)
MNAALTRPCPICGKPADARLKPFCSARCADVDLNRWLAGAYVVPGTEDDEPAEAGAHAASLGTGEGR